MKKLYEVTFKDRCKGCGRFINKVYQYCHGLLKNDEKYQAICIFCGRYHNYDNYEYKEITNKPTDFVMMPVSEMGHDSSKSYSEEQVEAMIEEYENTFKKLSQKLMIFWREIQVKEIEEIEKNLKSRISNILEFNNHKTTANK